MAPPVYDVSVTEFAELIGRTSQRVYQLLQKSMPSRKRSGTTRIVPKEAIRWLIEYETWEFQQQRKTTSDVPDEGEERALKMRAERQLKELELLHASKQVVAIADFNEFTERVLGTFTAVVSGRLQRFERDMVAVKDTVDARKLISRMQAGLMEGARSYGDQIDDEAREIERALAAEATRAAPAETDDADEPQEELDIAAPVQPAKKRGAKKRR